MENKYFYKKVILLGAGKFAYECAAEVQKYIGNVEVFEYNVENGTVLEKLCRKNGIAYYLCDKEELTTRLLGETEETLVVSAGNTFLVPGKVIEKDNLTLINWHNALLPRHKGRNAEAWCIYEGDKQTGITWHKITAGVDEGDIILQRQIELTEDMTALGLFKKQCSLGVETFAEILESLLKNCYESHKQENCREEQMHYSYEIPNDGYLDLQWDFEKMSCFLRAMDYGALQLLGEIKVKWEQEEYCFRKYKMTDAEGAPEGGRLQEEKLIIVRDGRQIVLRQ